MESKVFAIDLVRRSHEWAEDYVAQEYGPDSVSPQGPRADRVLPLTDVAGVHAVGATMFKALVDPKRLLVDERTADVIPEHILADDAQALDSLVDAETAKRLEGDVIPDEGQHIRYGWVILERYATSTEVQRMALHAQQQKMTALKVSHGDLVDRVLAHEA